MSTITIELIQNGDFAIMYEVPLNTGGSWLCTTRDIAEGIVAKFPEEALSYIERMILYKAIGGE